MNEESALRPQATREQAGFFSTVATFSLAEGTQVQPDGLAGYYIDFRPKAITARWPPDGHPPFHRRLHVASAQWGLGSFEQYLAGAGEAWLASARDCADELVERQLHDGPDAGGWVHGFDYEHTFPLRAPWLSAMAQGQAASLLVRMWRVFDDERYADAAHAALRPMAIDVAAGGTRTLLQDGPFYEEYPTQPGSYVLNGAIFAIWGLLDVAQALADRPAREAFEAAVDTLAGALHRWDTGSWSRYDLFPHPVANVASSFYHDLHIKQLRVLQRLAPRPQLEATAQRWAVNMATARDRRSAFARKALFRCLVPRHPRLARRLPWSALRR